MKVIICRKCGEIQYYTNFDIQKVMLAFDADGNELDVPYDPVSVERSIVKRCPHCNSIVHIEET